MTEGSILKNNYSEILRPTGTQNDSDAKVWNDIVLTDETSYHNLFSCQPLSTLVSLSLTDGIYSVRF